MNNVNVNVPQVATKVNRKPADKYNLARSKGEYAPKWTQKTGFALVSKLETREMEDLLLWA